MRLAIDPPDDSRKVILRFGDNGERDCFGFYWRAENAWYKTDGSKAKKNAVHPTHWMEASVSIYQVVDGTGRVIFDECTMEESEHFAKAIARRTETVRVAIA